MLMPCRGDEINKLDIDWNKIDWTGWTFEASRLWFCTRPINSDDCAAGSMCEGCSDPPKRFVKNDEI